ncbi:MAG: Hpt domain-containing protein [Magnetococcus sp. DMHC-1]|nr:Hpt domain-containing protein [Magnetococcales bacterium]
MPPDPTNSELPWIPDTLAGIDLTAGLCKANGNRHLYRKLLRLFHQNNSDIDQKILALLQTGDHPTARRLAHTIVGVAGTLGAHALQIAAKTLEQAITRHDPDITSRHPESPWHLFQNALHVVIQAIATLEQTDQDQHPPPNSTPSLPIPLTDEEIQAIVPLAYKLAELLETDISEAMHQFDLLKSRLAGTDHADHVTILEEHLTLFDTDAAGHTLARLTRALHDTMPRETHA